MANSKGKNPRDKQGISATKWSADMRARFPVPEGCKVLVSFPHGPDGGTWDQSTVNLATFYAEERIGTYHSWSEALAALEAVDRGEDPPKPRPARRGAQHEPLKAVLLAKADALDAEAKRLIDKAATIRDLVREGVI